MRLRPLTPRAICVPGSGRRIGGDGGRDHVDEGAVDLVDLRPDIGAEERRRGEIERQLLHRRIEQHLAGLRLPLRDARGDAVVEIARDRTSSART